MPSASVLHLAGFALAHAAWHVCDAPHAELLVPFVVLRVDGQQELTHFEAETQDAAVEEGKRAVSRLSGRAEAWAFAREGTLRMGDGGAGQDVLVVEFGGDAVAGRYVLIQPYRRAAEDRAFALAGDPILTLAGELLDGETARPVLAGVEGGVRQHSAAAELWDRWRREAHRDGRADRHAEPVARRR